MFLLPAGICAILSLKLFLAPYFELTAWCDLQTRTGGVGSVGGQVHGRLQAAGAWFVSFQVRRSLEKQLALLGNLKVNTGAPSVLFEGHGSDPKISTFELFKAFEFESDGSGARRR